MGVVDARVDHAHHHVGGARRLVPRLRGVDVGIGRTRRALDALPGVVEAPVLGEHGIVRRRRVQRDVPVRLGPAHAAGPLERTGSAGGGPPRAHVHEPQPARPQPPAQADARDRRSVGPPRPTDARRESHDELAGNCAVADGANGGVVREPRRLVPRRGGLRDGRHEHGAGGACEHACSGDAGPRCHGASMRWRSTLGWACSSVAGPSFCHRLEGAGSFAPWGAHVYVKAGSVGG